MTDHLDKTRNDRNDFVKGNFTEIKFSNPMHFFSEWYREAHEKNCADPHAFVLSTVSKESKPSSRIVYMRELVEEGFIFYTNYESKKGRELEENQFVAALFYWDCAERQVRIEGKVEKIDSKISDDYFASRPRISQIGAWASAQSQVIENREELEKKIKYFEEKFPETVPRPPHWGGYLILPNYFEFWQGRLGRLHDRLCYQQEKDNWSVKRISP